MTNKKNRKKSIITITSIGISLALFLSVFVVRAFAREAYTVYKETYATIGYRISWFDTMSTGDIYKKKSVDIFMKDAPFSTYKYTLKITSGGNSYVNCDKYTLRQLTKANNTVSYVLRTESSYNYERENSYFTSATIPGPTSSSFKSFFFSSAGKANDIYYDVFGIEYDDLYVGQYFIIEPLFGVTLEPNKECCMTTSEIAFMGRYLYGGASSGNISPWSNIRASTNRHYPLEMYVATTNTTLAVFLGKLGITTMTSDVTVTNSTYFTFDNILNYSFGLAVCSGGKARPVTSNPMAPPSPPNPSNPSTPSNQPNPASVATLYKEKYASIGFRISIANIKSDDSGSLYNYDIVDSFDIFRDTGSETNFLKTYNRTLYFYNNKNQKVYNTTKYTLKQLVNAGGVNCGYTVINHDNPNYKYCTESEVFKNGTTIPKLNSDSNDTIWEKFFYRAIANPIYQKMFNKDLDDFQMGNFLIIEPLYGITIKGGYPCCMTASEIAVVGIQATNNPYSYGTEAIWAGIQVATNKNYPWECHFRPLSQLDEEWGGFYDTFNVAAPPNDTVVAKTFIEIFALGYGIGAHHGAVYPYTYKFNANGGSWSSGETSLSGEYTEAAGLIAKEAPTRSGYIFLGWQLDSCSLSTSAGGWPDLLYQPIQLYRYKGNVVFSARWAKGSIKYLLNGGSVSSPWTVNSSTMTINSIINHYLGRNDNTSVDSSNRYRQLYVKGKNVTLRSKSDLSLKKTGYDFAGWKVVSDGKIGSTTYEGGNAYKPETLNSTAANSEADIYLQAQWTGYPYTVKYYVDGVLKHTQNCVYGTEYSYKTMSSVYTLPAGKHFTATTWNLKSDLSGGTRTPGGKFSNLTTTKNDTISLYAKTATNTYKVNYYVDDVLKKTQNCNYGTNYNYYYFSSVYSIPTGKHFVKTKWNSKSALSGTEYAQNESFSNLTTTNGGIVNRYAKTEDNSYSVKYYVDGTLKKTQSCKYGTSYNYLNFSDAYTLPKGKHFTKTKWNSKSDFSGTNYTQGAAFSNLTTTNGDTIYRYTATADNVYYVNYYVDGVLKKTQTCEYSKEYSYLAFSSVYTLPAGKHYLADKWNAKSDLSGTTYSTGTKFSKLTDANEGVVSRYIKTASNTVTLTMQLDGSTFTDYTPGSGLAPVLEYTKNGKTETIAMTKKSGGVYTASDVPNGTYNVMNVWSKASTKRYTITTVNVNNDNHSTIHSYYSLTVTKDDGIASTSPSGTKCTWVVKTGDFTVSATQAAGHTFDSWTGTMGSTAISSTENSYKISNVTNKVTIKANSKTSTITITCDKNGGTGGTDKFYEIYGSKFYIDTSKKTAITKITVPTKTGYTFDGYYSSESSNNGSGTLLVDATGTILAANTYWKSDATIYAKWTPITYTIKYVLDNVEKTAWEQKGIKYGDDVTLKAYTQEGRYVTDWYTVKAAASPYTLSGKNYAQGAKTKNLSSTKSDVVYLYAKTYVKLRYSGNDKTYTGINSVYKIEKLSGYTSTYLTENSSMYEQIVYNKVGLAKSSIMTGSKSGLTNVKTGYRFNGWNSKTDGSGTAVAYAASGTISFDDIAAFANKSGNAVVYIQFAINSSTLTVNPDGGTWGGKTTAQSFKQNYNTTKAIAVPTGKKVTATFDGNGGTSEKASQSGNLPFKTWTKSSTFYGTISSLTAAATYTYPAEHNVTSTITASYNPIEVTFPNATRAGYRLVGWAETKTATTAKYVVGAKKQISDNVTFYAVWSPASVKVYYNANGGACAAASHTSGSNKYYHAVGSDGLMRFSKSAAVTASSAAYYDTYTYKGGSFDPYNANGALGLSKTGYLCSENYTINEKTGTLYQQDAKTDIASAFDKLIEKGSTSITLYVNWNPITYTVEYYVNGTKQTSLAQTCTYDTSYTYKAFPALAAGTHYTKTGWTANSDMSGTTYAPGASFKNLTAINNAKVARYITTTQNVVTVSLKKDNTNWTTANADGLTKIRLVNKNDTSKYTELTVAAGNNTVEFKGVANGTYIVYLPLSAGGSIASTESYFGTVVVKDNNVSKQLDYYSVTVSGDAGIKSTTGGIAWIVKGGTRKLSRTVASGYSWKNWTATKDGTAASSSTEETYTISGIANKWVVTANTTKNTIKVLYHSNGGTVSGASHTSGSTTYYHAIGSDKLMRYSTSAAVTESSPAYSVNYTYKSGTFNPVNQSTFTLTKTGFKASELYTIGSSGTVKYSSDPNAEIAAAFDALIEKGQTEVVLYPVWNVNSYTIKYNLAGGSFPNPLNSEYTQGKYKYHRNPTTYKYIGTVETGYNSYFNVETPKRTGYKFNGWTVTNMDSCTHYIWYNSKTNTSTATSWDNTSAEGKSQMFYNLRSTSGEVVFTANWTPVTYEIVYVLNGGTLPNAYNSTYLNSSGSKFINNPTSLTYNTVTTGVDSLYAHFDHPTRKGYDFAGWNITNLDDTTHVYWSNQDKAKATFNDTSIANDSYIGQNMYLAYNLRSDSAAKVTFTAVWTPHTIKVYYNANGGTCAAASHTSGSNTYYHAVGSDGLVRFSTSAAVTASSAAYYQTYNYGTNTIDPWNYSSLGLSKTGHTGTQKYTINNTGTAYKQDGEGDKIAAALNKLIENGVKSATLYASWTPDTMTANIDHWMFGLTGGEGSNSAKNAIKLDRTTKQFTYDTDLTLRTTDYLSSTLPNGVRARLSGGKYVAGSSYSGSWVSYTLDNTFTKPNKNVSFQFNYELINYSITYDYNGGVAPAVANPTKYNVVYGAKFENAPTREGYDFSGWVLKGTSTKVTGFNVTPLDASAFAVNTSNNSVSDGFKAAVSGRTTGNKVLVAQWTPKTIKVYYNPNDGICAAASHTSGSSTFYHAIGSDKLMRYSSSSAVTAASAAYYQTYTFGSATFDAINQSSFGLSKGTYRASETYTVEGTSGTAYSSTKNSDLAKALDDQIKAGKTSVTLYAVWLSDVVTVNLKKNNTNWTTASSDGFTTLKLVNKTTGSVFSTITVTDGSSSFHFNNVTSGTYVIHAALTKGGTVQNTEKYFGTVTVNNGDVSITLNYYSIVVSGDDGIDPAKLTGGIDWIVKGGSRNLNYGVKNGYHFVNWTGKHNTTAITASTAATYAIENISEKWEIKANSAINTSTLKVDPKGGTWNGKTTVQSFTQNALTKMDVPVPTGAEVTATFNGNGGTSAKANQKGNLPFKTWTKSNPFYGTMSSLVTAGTYTFAANNAVTSTINASYNGLTVTFPNATRNGYRLLGWADSNTATVSKYAVGSTTTITANKTFYAVWSMNSSTLQVDPNGGMWEGSTAVTSLTQNASTTRTIDIPTGKSVTATFNGNGGTPDKANQKGNLPFKTWTKSTTFYGTMSTLTTEATYTFANENAVTSTITASYNGLTVTFPNASKSGYTLLGWADSSTATTAKYSAGSTTTINTDKTFYAVWSNNVSTLKVDPNGGTWENSTSVVSLTQNASTTRVIDVPIGKSVTATFNGNGGTSAKANQTGNLPFKTWTKSNPFYGSIDKLTAKATYTYGTDNNVTSTITASYNGLTVTFPNATKANHTLVGWADSSTATTAKYAAGSTTTITANKTFYAVWKINTSTLKVNPNGGTWEGSTAVTSLTQNASTTRTIDVPTGKSVTATFNGNGGTSAKANQKGNLPFKTWTKSDPFYGTIDKLTAKATYTYGTTDNVTSTITASYNGLIVTFPNATRTGYTLLGWADSNTATTSKYAAGSTTTITANKTFYAVWTPISYNIKYVVDGVEKTDFAQNGIKYDQAVTLAKYDETSRYETDWYTVRASTSPFTLSGTSYAQGKTGVKNLTTVNGSTVTLYAKTYVKIRYSGNDTAYTGTSSVYKIEKVSGLSNTYLTEKSNLYEQNVYKEVGLAKSSIMTGSKSGLTNVKTGYTFNGWNSKADGKGTIVAYAASGTVPFADIAAFTNENGNAIVFIQFSINSSTLTIDPNGGTWGGKTTAQSFKQNYNTTKAIAVPTGKTVKATFNGNGGTSATANQSGSLPFKAWTKSSPFYGTMSTLTAAATYTYPADRNVTSTITASYNGLTVTFPTATRTGYTLLGWADSEMATSAKYTAGSTTTITADKTFYAVWTPISYNIRYVVDGVEKPDLAQNGIKYGQSVTLATYDEAKRYETVWFTVRSDVAPYTLSGTSYAQGKTDVKNLTTVDGATVTLYAKTYIKLRFSGDQTNYTGTNSSYKIEKKEGWSYSYLTNNGSIVELFVYKEVGLAKNLIPDGASTGLTNCKTGYTFKNWNSAKNGSGKVIEKGANSDVYEFDTIASFANTSGNSIVYIQFNINSSSLKVNPNGGTWEGSTATQTITQNAASTKTITVPTGKSVTATFNGNGGTPDKANQKGNLPFKTWTKSTTFYGTMSTLTTEATYTFANENAVTSTITASYNGLTVTFPNASKSGYTLLGWADTSTATDVKYEIGSTVTITTNKTFYAVWSSNASTLKVDPNGGTWNGKTTVQTFTKVSGTQIDISVPTGNPVKATFNGNGGTSAKTDQTGNLPFKTWTKSNPFYGTMSSLTAAAKYTFGTTNAVVSTITASYNGLTVTFPSATRTNYTLLGWADSNTATTAKYATGSTITIIANKTFYAVWKINTSTLKVDPNGRMWNGKTTVQSFTQNAGTTKAIAVPALNTYVAKFNTNGGSAVANITKTETFKAWTKSATFYGTMSSLTGNATYTYPSNDGVTSTITATYNQVTVKLPTTTKTGYNLIGWTDDPTGSTPEYEPGETVTLTTSETTFYAVWDPIKYNISYVVDGVAKPDLAQNNIKYDQVFSLRKYDEGSRYETMWYTGRNTVAPFTLSGTSYAQGATGLKNLTTTDGMTITLYAKTYVKLRYSGGTTSYAGTSSVYKIESISGYSNTYLTKNGSLYEQLVYKEVGVERTAIHDGASTGLTNSKLGYTFKNWNSATNGKGTVIEKASSGTYLFDTIASFANSGGNSVVYVQFDINTSTLKVNPNGGTWNGSTSTQSFTQNYNTTKSVPVPTGKSVTTTFDAEGGTASKTKETGNLPFVKWTKTGTNGTMSTLTGSATYTFGPTKGVTDTLTASYDPLTITFPTATKPGYDLTGWTDVDGGTTAKYPPDTTAKIDKNTTYYAVWTPKTIKVYYHANGGVCTAASHISGSTTYYHAVGSDGLMRFSSSSAVAASSAAYYLTYKFDSGTIDPLNYATLGLSRTGYTGTLKYKINNAGTEYAQDGAGAAVSAALDDMILAGKTSVTLYAGWTANKYSVKYNGNGATSGSMANSTYTYDVTGKLAANKFARVYNVTYKGRDTKVITGYPVSATKATATMLGWGTTAAGATVNYPEPYSGNPVSPYTYNNVLNWAATNNAVINIYAKWELGSVTLPDLPDLPGYTPDGWVPEGDLTSDPLPPGTVITPEKPETYVAKYTEIPYKLTYKTNGGVWSDGTTTDKYQNYFVTTDLTLLGGPKKDGFVMAGWKVAATVGSWIKGTIYEKEEHLGTGNYGNATLEAVWIKQLYLEPVIPNAPYTLGTDVISSFKLYNPTGTDRIPSDHVNLTFKIYDGDYLLETRVLKNVVVPTDKYQLVWFKWTVPAEIDGRIKIVGSITEDAFVGEFGIIQRTYNTAILETSYPKPFNPNPSKPIYEGWTRDSVPGTPTCANTNSTTWSVWEYVDGSFVKKTYGITANGIAVIRPDVYSAEEMIVVCPYCETENYADSAKCRKCRQTLPDDLVQHLRGGYGIVLDAQAAITTDSGINKPDASAYTEAQNAIELRPEYNYEKTNTDYSVAMGTNKVYVTLDKVGNVFMFTEDAEAVQEEEDDTRYLPIELWYSTGMHGSDAVTYAVMVEFSDIWTPNGMLTLSAVSNEYGCAGTISDNEGIH